MKKIFLSLFILTIFCSCSCSGWLPTSYTGKGKYHKKPYLSTELTDCKLKKHPKKHIRTVRKKLLK